MIEDIIDSINSNIANNIGIATEQIYGIAERFELEGNVYPAIKNTEWEKISLDDAHELMIYHRVTGMSSEENPEFSFGSFQNDNQETWNMLLTVVLKRPYGRNEVAEIKRYIPKSISNTDYAFVTITGGEINSNQDEIVTTEWGEQDYKHKTEFAIFQISYQIETIVCTH